MTKIVCISDTHLMHRLIEVPDGDIFIHSGDFLARGELHELSSFLDWLEQLPHKVKLMVPGNHDICIEGNKEVEKEFQKAGAHLLIDKEYTDPDSGLRFYGVPWTPDFFPDIWAFQYRDAGCTPEEIWAKVPDHTDILISHGPPYGVGDSIIPIGAPPLGSSSLRKRIEEIKGSLRHVVCGHIHGSYGMYCTDFTDPYGVEIINASICTEAYAPTNAPIVFNHTWETESCE